jgi:hypothetical protein
MVDTWWMRQVTLNVTLSKYEDDGGKRNGGATKSKRGGKKRKRTQSKHGLRDSETEEVCRQALTRHFSYSRPELEDEMLFESTGDNSGYSSFLSSEAAGFEDELLFEDAQSSPSQPIETGFSCAEENPRLLPVATDLLPVVQAKTFLDRSDPTRGIESMPSEPSLFSPPKNVDTLTELIDAAMQLTICSKTVSSQKGMYSKGPTLTTRLCELAPGLWDNHYAEVRLSPRELCTAADPRQAISTRVPLIPTITYALSHSMYTNARSSSLKEKIGCLVLQHARGEQAERQTATPLTDDASIRYGAVKAAIWKHIRKRLADSNPRRRCHGLKPLSCQMYARSDRSDVDEGLFYPEYRALDAQDALEDELLFNEDETAVDVDDMLREDDDYWDDELGDEELFDEDLFREEEYKDWLFGDPDDKLLFLPQPGQEEWEPWPTEEESFHDNAPGNLREDEFLDMF